MCRQLESIARTLGYVSPARGWMQKEVKGLLVQLLLLSFRVEDTRMELLPELMKLTEDEESAVRLAAFDTIINLMEIMDSGESSALPGL